MHRHGMHRHALKTAKPGCAIFDMFSGLRAGKDVSDKTIVEHFGVVAVWPTPPAYLLELRERCVLVGKYLVASTKGDRGLVHDAKLYQLCARQLDLT